MPVRWALTALALTAGAHLGFTWLTLVGASGRWRVFGLDFHAQYRHWVDYEGRPLGQLLGQVDALLGALLAAHLAGG